MKFKREIVLPWYNNDEWRLAVKKLIDKLGLKYSEEDVQKFENTSSDESVTVEYDDEDTEAILESLNKCDYLMSHRV